MHVGGTFYLANVAPSPRWAIFTETNRPWIANPPDPITAPWGEAVAFSGAVAHGYQASFHWLRNGEPLSDGMTPYGSRILGSSTEMLTILDAGFDDEASYQLVATTDGGSDTSSAAGLTIESTTDAPGTKLPLGSAFLGLLPNPTRDGSVLSFRLSSPQEQVQVRVLDVNGRLVRLLQPEARPAGVHQLRWDGRDDQGRAVSTGLYFVTLEAGGNRLGMKRLAIVR